MLPFPVKEERRWQCFVCGMEYRTPDEFRSHIVDEHEEGRDYVLCPLERCAFPVRDIPLHFKNKHPYDKAPKGVQSRALVFRDHRDAKRKKKVNFRQGDYISAKNHGKSMPYRSGYEADVYALLEEMHCVVAYEVEPFAIEYWFNGRHRRYIPDLIITFDDGHAEIWEIKPNNQTSLPINTAKWAAATNHCVRRGWDFCVKTEKGIADLRRDIAESRRT